MKRFIVSSIAIIAVLTVTVSLYAGGMGGGGMMGGGAGGMGGGMGGFGGGAGGGMGGGGMGGMMGGGQRGQRGAARVERPDKEARLAAVAELETQLATLKKAVEDSKDVKAPDPNDQDAVTEALAAIQPETDAITAMMTTLGTLRGTGGGRGGRGGFGGASADVLSELRVLANGEKATKTVARLDALIKEAQTAAGGRGGAGRGMGAGGGRGAGGAGGAGGGRGAGAGGGRGAGRGAGAGAGAGAAF